MLSERSQIKKLMYYFYLYKILRIGKSTDTESRFVVVRGWGEEVIGSDGLMGMGFPFGGDGMF